MSHLDGKGSTGSRSVLRIQLAIASAVFVTTIVAPPASGTMIAIPVAPSAHSQVARWATEADGKIVGSGRIPGSLVILGDRDRLLPAAIFNHALLLRAPAFLCSLATQEISK
jgi:hypothetical protein